MPKKPQKKSKGAKSAPKPKTWPQCEPSTRNINLLSKKLSTPWMRAVPQKTLEELGVPPMISQSWASGLTNTIHVAKSIVLGFREHMSELDQSVLDMYCKVQPKKAKKNKVPAELGKLYAQRETFLEWGMEKSPKFKQLQEKISRAEEKYNAPTPAENIQYDAEKLTTKVVLAVLLKEYAKNHKWAAPLLDLIDISAVKNQTEKILKAAVLGGNLEVVNTACAANKISYNDLAEFVEALSKEE